MEHGRDPLSARRGKSKPTSPPRAGAAASQSTAGWRIAGGSERSYRNRIGRSRCGGGASPRRHPPASAGQSPSAAQRTEARRPLLDMPRLGHLQVRCRLFAALPISLDLVRDLHALREAVHSRSLNSADVDEHVLASLIRLDKPVALCLVEPLHRASSHVESPLKLLGTGSMSAARRDYSELKSRSSALSTKVVLGACLSSRW